MIGLRLGSNASEHVTQTAPRDVGRPFGSPPTRNFRGNNSRDLTTRDGIDFGGGRRPIGTYIDAHPTPLPVHFADYTPPRPSRGMTQR